MKMWVHFIAASIGGVIAFVLTGDFAQSLLFFVPAFFIDVDHVPDYAIIYKKIDFRKMIKGGFYKDKIWVLLHSWEIPLAALIFVPINFSLWFALGYGIHLVMDLAEYRFKHPFLTYFLTYRLAIGFERKKMCANA